MNENNYTVYMHKNKINGKVYIGITSQQPVKRRWRKGSCYKNCNKFYKAIQKYGWNNFEHIILFENFISSISTWVAFGIYALYCRDNSCNSIFIVFELKDALKGTQIACN